MEQQLETLRKQRNDAYETFHQNEQEVAQKLTDIIKMHCEPEGVEAVIYLNMDKPWSSYRNEKNRYCFRGRVAFLTDDPERIKKGYTEDFGSNFDITINEEGGIEINKGTIGSYTSKDKYQVARDRMLCSIWDNESVIVGCMLNNFKYDLYKTYWDLDIACERLEQDIKHEEENRVRNEMLQKLKSSKYLYQEHVSDKYDYDLHKYISKVHRFHSVFVIEKVTDKSILGYEQNYPGCDRRLNLSHTLYSLLRKEQFCGNEVPQNYEEAIEEGKGQ